MPVKDELERGRTMREGYALMNKAQFLDLRLCRGWV